MIYAAVAALSVVSLIQTILLVFLLEKCRIEREKLYLLIKADSLPEFTINTNPTKSKTPPNFVYNAMVQAFKNKQGLDGDHDE